MEVKGSLSEANPRQKQETPSGKTTKTNRDVSVAQVSSNPSIIFLKKEEESWGKEF
jgi:hypothetical protein